jgi:thiol-disulfide isomerase/thioredoxin
MPGKFWHLPTCTRLCFALSLVIALSPETRAQTESTTTTHATDTSDALACLRGILANYSGATTYQIETIEETRTNSELYRDWTKTFTTSIVGPKGQYRFEFESPFGKGLQISDGKTEWIYLPPFHQYIQRPSPEIGPSPVQSRAATNLSTELAAAQRTLKSISELQKVVRTAVYAPDEILNLNGKNIPCTVVNAEIELPAKSHNVHASYMFWVEKRSNLIRKVEEHQETHLSPSRPDVAYQVVRERVFTAVQLNPASFPDGSFTFDPPSTATLVKVFEDPATAAVIQLVGKQAPSVNFKTVDGKEISLQSLKGKAILLDFWATWCLPCVESLPTMEKLYKEGADKGIVFLSTDENEEPQEAAAFWSAHREPWPNYHATDEILKRFPEHGIPYIVLIDASGTVVFSQAGMDEEALRSAVIKVASSRANAQ